MEWKAIALVVLIALQVVVPVVGYGEPDSSGHPNYFERANHVFLNAARISPSGYKSVYMAGYSPSPSGILNSYPAVPPVYLEPKLVNSASAHSTDMATNNCFAHNSCDGTETFTRIKSYYTCSGSMGENIAAGLVDPLDTSNQWLCDQSGSACAADKSGGDGHRSNIMGSGYKAVGVGYSYGASSTYKHYWTQDFGGAMCSPAPTSPVYGGSHRVKSGTTKFIAVYYTSSAVAPSSANVVIGGTSYPLSVDVGAAGAGTYAFSQTSGTSCRSYYFTFGSVRYPETGCLVTYNEGSCTTSFDASCAGSVTPTNPPQTPAPTTPPTQPPQTAAPTARPTQAPQTPAPTAQPTQPPQTGAPTNTPTQPPQTVAPTNRPTNPPTATTWRQTGSTTWSSTTWRPTGRPGKKSEIGGAGNVGAHA